MNCKYSLMKFILILCLFIIVQVILDSDVKEVNHNRQEIKKYFLSIGAKEIEGDELFDQFVFDQTFLCAVKYDLNLNSLCYISVFFLEKDSDKGKKNCIYLPEFNRFIAYFNEVLPLGEYIKEDPISVVGPSGWKRCTKIYKNALVEIRQQNCLKPNPNKGCCIVWFSVQYWMKISGQIESKRIDKIGAEFTDDSEKDYFMVKYILVVKGKTIEVPKKTYDRLSVGQTVDLKVISLGDSTYWYTDGGTGVSIYNNRF